MGENRYRSTTHANQGGRRVPSGQAAGPNRPRQAGPARRPSPQSRSGSAGVYSRRRRLERRRRRRVLIGAGILALLVLALIIILVSRRPAAKDAEAFSPQPTEEILTPSPSPTPAVTPEPSPTPRSDVADPAYAALRPKPVQEGWLPVFSKIKTEEKVIAITVDDCYQAGNLQEIIDIAMENGAKLTFFPIGENVLRAKQQESLRYAWENGMELENHTFTHNGLYNCTDEELAAEIYKQNLALSKILGVEYQVHFLRPMGGDARYDQRIHAYIAQMGYYGVAHWSESGTRGIDKLQTLLAPGQVYLFHTTDKDLERLSFFIPYAVSQGYRLVTLNELFGYPPNECEELKIPIEEHVIPPLQPYEKVYVTYTEGKYAYGIFELQQRLVDLGYLSGGADGIYGENTTKAVKLFQAAAGLKADGKASPEMQERLFRDDAPRNPYAPV